jgi:hypothetical protein
VRKKIEYMTTNKEDNEQERKKETREGRKERKKERKKEKKLREDECAPIVSKKRRRRASTK